MDIRKDAVEQLGKKLYKQADSEHHAFTTFLARTMVTIERDESMTIVEIKKMAADIGSATFTTSMIVYLLVNHKIPLLKEVKKVYEQIIRGDING